MTQKFDSWREQQYQGEPTEDLNVPRMYFFGVYNPAIKGHFLYSKDGLTIRPSEEQTIPFRTTICDGGLLPQYENKAPHVVRVYHSIINGWTVLTMWDQTGDSRPGSNSSFIVEGEWTKEQMVEIWERNFPFLWQRIHKV